MDRHQFHKKPQNLLAYREKITFPLAFSDAGCYNEGEVMRMLVNFHIDRLDRLLFDFYRLTGLTVSIWDAEFNQLSYQPKEMCGFCRLVKSSPEGARRCYLSDKRLCMESAAKGAPATHTCHAGLLDTAIPIRFKESVMGYIMFGQVTVDPRPETRELLARLGAEIRVDPDELIAEYDKLLPYDSEKTAAAASILKMATRYLWLSQYIEIGYNTLASQIEEYILSHIEEPISVRDLCSRFAVSKNKLYSIAHEWFKMPIGDYIISVRISEAKRLLATTDLPVREIAARVGIRDYNYFTKFFKENVGIPPLRYRKHGGLGE